MCFLLNQSSDMTAFVALRENTTNYHENNYKNLCSSQFDCLVLSMWNMVASADRQAKRTLLGVILIKFSTGLAVIWGSCNVYFFSYLKHNGCQITSSTNSIILLCALIPTSLAVLLSNPFARLVGYRSAVRICAFTFLFSPLVINIRFSIEIFAVFWLVMPLTCFCLGAIPVLSCIWTHFRKDLSKISGVAVMAFSMGMIFWNLVFLFIVNPDNLGTVIDENDIPIFPLSVSENVFKASNTVYIAAGIFNIIGSFLISKKELTGLETNINDDSQDKVKEIKAMEHEPLMEIDRAVSSIQTRLSQSSQRAKTLLQGLKDKRFLLVFMISALMPIYLIYLVMNVKLIYMEYINDDHFLSYCSALVTISALVGAPLWGYIGDLKGFKFTLMMLVIFDSFVKLLGIFCFEKWNLALLFFLLGVNDKGMLTIIGPGLIGMFGIDMATELIPYKGLAVFLGYIIAPTFQILLWHILSLQKLLFIYFLFSLVAICLCLYLNYRVHYKIIDPSKQQELQKK